MPYLRDVEAHRFILPEDLIGVTINCPSGEGAGQRAAFGCFVGSLPVPFHPSLVLGGDLSACCLREHPGQGASLF